MKKKIDELAQLKQQLADTQRLLQVEKLKREALETMINIAEKELKIRFDSWEKRRFMRLSCVSY